MGTNAFSPQRAESFRHFLLLPSPSVVYHGRKPTNLRVSFGARATQLQTSRLRVRSHAGACSPPAQRATTGYAGRCAEVVKARTGGFLARAGGPRFAGFETWGSTDFDSLGFDAFALYRTSVVTQFEMQSRGLGPGPTLQKHPAAFATGRFPSTS